jgi:hypothetical protein
MKIFDQSTQFRRAILNYFILASCLLIFSVTPSQAQYLLQTGSPTFTTADPVELGFVNAANGIIHLEVPIASAPGRGKLGFAAKLVYDSRIWQIVNNGSNSWQPTNVQNIVSGSPTSARGGWRFVTSADPGSVTNTSSGQNCGSPYPTGHISYIGPFTWAAPDGTQHVFPIQTVRINGSGCSGSNVSSGDALAQDSSGFHMYVVNYGSATVFAKDGTQVYPSMKDSNGNYFSTGARHKSD